MSLMIVYLAAVNIVAFIMFGIDKKRAIKDQWRIPEATLLGLAFIGGSVGAFAGMQVFRHKTKHIHFKLFLPICAVITIFVFIFINRL